MEDSSRYTEGDLVTVRFTDEKGFDCDVEGEIVTVFEDSIVCEPTEMDSITRFRVDFSKSVVKLLLSDEFEESVVSYDVDEVSREEKSELEQVLERIDENEFENLDPISNGNTGVVDLLELDIGGNHYYSEKNLEGSGNQRFDSLEEEESYVHVQAG